MIEEIKKEIEILVVLDDVLYCKDCGSRNIKKSYKPYKIGENIMKILDKYKDKEIKFDDGSSKYAVVKENKQLKDKLDKIREYTKEVIKYELEILNEFPTNKFKPEYQINISRLNLAECIKKIVEEGDK